MSYHQELTQNDVAEIVGCSSKAACCIMRAIRRFRLGTYSHELRVSNEQLSQWLRAMSDATPLDLAWVSDDAFVCYFAGDANGAVKIGSSCNVRRRLEELQKHNSMPIRLLAAFDGGEATEAYYHGRFRQLRLHGEWFRIDGKLSQFLRGHSCHPITNS